MKWSIKSWDTTGEIICMKHCSSDIMTPCSDTQLISSSVSIAKDTEAMAMVCYLNGSSENNLGRSGDNSIHLWLDKFNNRQLSSMHLHSLALPLTWLRRQG